MTVATVCIRVCLPHMSLKIQRMMVRLQLVLYSWCKDSNASFPRHHVADQSKDQDQDCENTVSGLSGDETVSQHFLSLLSSLIFQQYSKSGHVTGRKLTLQICGAAFSLLCNQIPRLFQQYPEATDTRKWHVKITLLILELQCRHATPT